MVLRIASGRTGYKSSTDPYLSLETVCHNSSAFFSLEERRCQLANLSQHSSRLRDYRLLELESLQLATAVLFIASDDCVSITNSIAEVPVPSITQLRYYVGPGKNTAFFLSRCFSAGNFPALNETQYTWRMPTSTSLRPMRPVSLKQITCSVFPGRTNPSPTRSRWPELTGVPC